jgi:hypothetical protein
LATKSSVFAWTPAYPILQARISSPATWVDTINLRNNTAQGGNSVDVPTWAAGCVVTWNVSIGTLGAGVSWQIFRAVTLAFGTTQYLWTYLSPTVNQVLTGQFIVPFFDEPVFQLQQQNDLANTNGTVTSILNLLGFVRNV